MFDDVLLSGSDQPSDEAEFRIHNNLNMVAKRAFDIVTSATLLFLALPFMAVAGLMIWAFDGAPLVFAHRRVGKNGKVFRCLKLRTMVRDADAQLALLLDNDASIRAEWNATQKLKNDPRIIPVIGHILRKTSLDELPQLLNVLRGEMSMVGPRPVTRHELVKYGPAQPLYRSVRPGLTGPWQIGDRSDDTYESRVQKDVAYIRDWSLATDFRIVVETARVVVQPKGAY